MLFNISRTENTSENQLAKELLRLEQDRLDTEIQHLSKLLTENMQSPFETIDLTPRKIQKHSDFKQLALKTLKPPLSSKQRLISNPIFSSTDEFSPELNTERYKKVHPYYRSQKQNRSVNPTSRSHKAFPSWVSHQDTTFELDSSSENIPDESEVTNSEVSDYTDQMSINKSICNIPRAFPKKKKLAPKPKKRSKCREKTYNQHTDRGRAEYEMPAHYNPPVYYQYPPYMYNPYPYYIPPPMYSYPYPPQPTHNPHISEPVYHSQHIKRSKSVSKEVSTQFSNSILADIKHKPSNRESKTQYVQRELDLPRPNTIDIPAVSSRDNLPIESPKQSDPNETYKIVVKEPWVMNFIESENKISDLFQQKRKNMLDKLQEQKAKPKKDHKEKSAQELMTIRKQMLKSNSLKELHPRSESIETPTSVKKIREPSPDLLARLCTGEKSKVTSQEMKRITQKNYSALPEVQKKKTAEDKKQELKERRAKAKEFEQRLRGKILN